MDCKTFVNEIVVDILGKSISSHKNVKYGGSYNTLRSCIDRNNTIGDKVSLIISNMIYNNLFNIKKEKAIIYLKSFLSENEKRKFQNLEYNFKDIKELVYFVTDKLNKSFKTTKKLRKSLDNDNYKVVDLNKLLDMGWSIEEMMTANSSLAYETIEDLKVEHIGGLNQWLELYRKKSISIRSFLDDKDNIIGYWHFQPMFDDMFIKAKNGNLMENEIISEKIPQMLSGTYNVYFISICLKEKYRRKYKIFKKLFYSIIDVLEEFAEDDIFFNEICALAYSDDGISLSESVGLKYKTDHIECGKVYCGKAIDLVNSDLCRNYTSLINLYKKHYSL